MVTYSGALRERLESILNLLWLGVCRLSCTSWRTLNTIMGAFEVVPLVNLNHCMGSLWGPVYPRKSDALLGSSPQQLPKTSQDETRPKTSSQAPAQPLFSLFNSFFSCSSFHFALNLQQLATYIILLLYAFISTL
jgi:hypothetical protein